MDLTKIPLFETMRERMSFLSARQSVLAENVANANTPGYKARDVEEPDFAAMTEGSSGAGAMTVTNPMHISSSGTPAGNFKSKIMSDSESTPNGNSVVLEDQMMKVSSTQMDYATVTQLYRKALSMIRLAAGGQR
jgi:flagellar basal-body rod protein FlgB